MNALAAFIEGIFNRPESAKVEPARISPGDAARFIALLDSAYHVAKRSCGGDGVQYGACSLTLWADRDPASIYAFRLFTQNRNLRVEESIIGKQRMLMAYSNQRLVASLHWMHWVGA